LARFRPEPKEWPQLQRSLVKLDPHDAAARLLGEADVDILPGGRGAAVRRLQLDVADDAGAGDHEIVPAVIHLRAQELGGRHALAPQVAQQFADEEVLDQFLPGRRVLGVDRHRMRLRRLSWDVVPMCSLLDADPVTLPVRRSVPRQTTSSSTGNT
jgi:hypothetical protein